MIYTVTLNPSLDYLVHTDALRPGALCRTQGEALHPGGKGVNVSLVCAALGLPTRALGYIAGRTGALFASLLAETGVEYDLCRLDSGMTRINVKVSARQEQTELNGAGPAIPAAALDRLLDKLDALGAGDWLVLSGSIPAGVPVDTYARLLARAHERGARTLVDTAGDALKNALPCAPDLIKPNREELAALVGGTPTSPAGAAACARTLRAAGARQILLSLGGEGAVFVPEHGAALYLPAPTGGAVQPVGAGDAMAAGWLYAQVHELPVTEALRFAVAAGSAAAFSAWLPDRPAIEAVLARTGVPQPLEQG
ncbi:MAG: 1-phosphofructokinase [Eubacteriales bacterium]|nr:1-phosphofructokinase [Eubacteriales bacterium]